MKLYWGIALVGCIAASTLALAQGSGERVVSLIDIVDAHKVPVRSGNTITEMELTNCKLIVIRHIINSCEVSNLGHTKTTTTFDLQYVSEIWVSDNDSHNAVSVLGSDPDNNGAFSKEYEACDGKTSLVENGTGFGFPLNDTASQEFRGAQIEFDGESCLEVGS